METRDSRVEVSVPLRVDIGGTWDLKAFGLLYERLSPATVNIALDLPTVLGFRRRSDDLIVIKDPYHSVSTSLDKCDFRSPFGLLLALSVHCGYSGFSLDIEYSVPPRSGLGGSGALAAGFIIGMKHLFLDPNTLYYEIAQMVHEIEESLRFSFCGFQDQCAALWGGVNKWLWTYNQGEKFSRTQLLPPRDYGELSQRLIVAYLGGPHRLDINQRQVGSFFDPNTRAQWFEINQITQGAAQAIIERDWAMVADCISKENAIRISLIPERLASEAIPLMESAEEINAGFGIAGAGAGGCVFALCPDPQRLAALSDAWSAYLSEVESAQVFERPAVSAGLSARFFKREKDANSEPQNFGDRGLDGSARASVAVYDG